MPRQRTIRARTLRRQPDCAENESRRSRARRLRSAIKPLTPIIRGDLAHRGERSITTSRAQVTVVDPHNLPDRAQRFVVGVTLRGEFARKERQGTARPLTLVVLDELTKYPREGDLIR